MSPFLARPNSLRRDTCAEKYVGEKWAPIAKGCVCGGRREGLNNRMSSDLTFLTNESGNTLRDRYDARVRTAAICERLMGVLNLRGFMTEVTKESV